MASAAPQADSWWLGHVEPDDVVIADIAGQALDILLHGSKSAHMNGIVKTFTHTSIPIHPETLLKHTPSFSSGGVSLTHPMLPSFLHVGFLFTHPMLHLPFCGEFLLHIPCCLLFLKSGEFLLHITCWLHFHLRSLYYTSHADSFLCGELLLHIPC